MGEIICYCCVRKWHSCNKCANKDNIAKRKWVIRIGIQSMRDKEDTRQVDSTSDSETSVKRKNYEIKSRHQNISISDSASTVKFCDHKKKYITMPVQSNSRDKCGGTEGI